MKQRAQAPDDSAITIDVSLLGRDYKVACRKGEEAELRDAVAFLDRRMREIREGSKTTSPERVAVMAALNLAHDFQRARGSAADATGGSQAIDVAGMRSRIAAMRSAIDQALPNQEKLL
jgi:cell division protein ZapA